MEKASHTLSPHPLNCNPCPSHYSPLELATKISSPTNCPKLCRVSKPNLRFLPCHEVLLHHIQLSYTPSLLMPRFSSKCPLFLKPSKETVQGLPWTSFLPAPPSVYILSPQVFHSASEPSVLEMPPPSQVQLLGTGIFLPTSLPDKSPFKHDLIVLPLL